MGDSIGAPGSSGGPELGNGGGVRGQGQIMRSGLGAGELVEGGNGRVGGDGQGRADPQTNGGIDWEEGDAFRQEGELRKKAHLKGKIISLFVNTLSLRSL